MTTSRVLVGFHAVQARLRAQPKSVIEILLDSKREDARARQLQEQARAAGVRLMRVPAERLNGLSQNRHQGVAAFVAVSDKKLQFEDLLDELVGPAFILVLDGVTDPRNLGACLRVADAAGVNAVVAPRDRAVGLNETAAKAASGAAESVPYYMVTNLARCLDDLKDRGIWVVGTDDSAEQDLYESNLPGSIAWVLGAEGEGMRRLTRERCDQLVRIPMNGQVESLNVSVAAGICLYESVRRRGIG
jgi:23S rRNA (guanosine2251-2'-O)-methyltransferase